MKKVLILFIIIMSIVIIIKYFYSDYNLEYKVSGYDIKTKYKDERYYFEIKGKHTFNFDIYQKRTFKKLKIKQIKEITGEEFECIVPVIDNASVYPLCTKEGQIIDYNLIEDEMLKPYKKQTDEKPLNDSAFTYFNNLDNNTYIALWNYKGYILMNGKTYKNLEIFENDKYDNSLSHQINDKIYMPNYNQEHEYNELIEVDIINQTKKAIKLDYTIDYDSYIVGHIKNKLYIFDNKYSVLYEIDIKKKQTKIIGNNEKGFVKYDGKDFVSCSKVEYKVNRITITEEKESNYKYEINSSVIKTFKENENIKIKILNENVSIINEHKNHLYYVYDNYLIKYTPEKGNEKIFYFFELNFNKDKTIYIYNK